MSEKRKRAALQEILDACASRWEELSRFAGYKGHEPAMKHLEKVMRIARRGLKPSNRVVIDGTGTVLNKDEEVEVIRT